MVWSSPQTNIKCFFLNIAAAFHQQPLPRGPGSGGPVRARRFRRLGVRPRRDRGGHGGDGKIVSNLHPVTRT